MKKKYNKILIGTLFLGFGVVSGGKKVKTPVVEDQSVTELGENQIPAGSTTNAADVTRQLNSQTEVNAPNPGENVPNPGEVYQMDAGSTTNAADVTRQLNYQTEGKAPNPAADTKEGAAPNPAVDTKEGDAPNPAADTKEGDAPNPAADTKEGDAPNPVADTKEGDAPNPVADAKEGDAPNPAADTKEGDAPNPAVDTKEGDAPNPAADTKEGDAPNPAADTKEGDAPNPAVDTKEGDAPNLAADTKEGDAPNPVVDTKEGDAPNPAADTKEGAAPNPAEVKAPKSEENASETAEASKSEEGSKVVIPPKKTSYKLNSYDFVKNGCGIALGGSYRVNDTVALVSHNTVALETLSSVFGGVYSLNEDFSFGAGFLGVVRWGNSSNLIKTEGETKTNIKVDGLWALGLSLIASYSLGNGLRIVALGGYSFFQSNEIKNHYHGSWIASISFVYDFNVNDAALINVGLFAGYNGDVEKTADRDDNSKS